MLSRYSYCCGVPLCSRYADKEKLVQQVEIHINGHLTEKWSNWFGGLSLQHTVDGQTVLCGTLADQSALYGLIEKLSSLGLQLLSVATTGSSTVNEEARHV